MNTTALVRGRSARSVLPATLTIASGRQHTADTILRAWLEGKSEHTIRSYQHDLQNFAMFFSRALGISPLMRVPDALGRLFRQSSPSAHEIALGFRSWMMAAGMAPSTINRHVSTLRSVSKLARMLGLTVWALEAPGVKSERRRDVRGPTIEKVRAMLDLINGDTEQETRNRAIVLVFVCLGLRVSELCGLNREETDLENGTVWIHGKGRREKELVPLPPLVVAALRRYLQNRRGPARGPLFLSRSSPRVNASPDRRLGTRSVASIVRVLGQRVGIRLWPHALRHTAITTAIEHGQKAGLGIDQIRSFSRHKDLTTMLRYRDEHDSASVQRQLVEIVSETLTA